MLMNCRNTPYFVSYKMEVWQNIVKNLDPSYKMDLDLWDCLGKVKFVSQQSFI